MIKISTTPYSKLLTYRYSYIIYHLNNQFINRYVNHPSQRRTKEQMQQAARSGKQNIVEGASQGTSLKGYIMLLGISRGSYEELGEDYLDMAVTKGVSIWNWQDERYKRFRRYRIFIKDEPNSPLPPIPQLPTNNELAINIMIDLIKRQGYLIDQQRRSLEKKHEHEGGLTERLYRKRKEYLSQKNKTFSS